MNRTGETPYIGRFYHALEQKGRLSIPVTFRTKLGDSAIITRGLDGCLFLFDEHNWQQLLQTTTKGSLTQKKHRDWARYVSNTAIQVNLDGQGRILIPEYLRDQAHLSTSAVIVGSIDRIEIWDQKTYHNYFAELEANAEAIAESLTIA